MSDAIERLSAAEAAMSSGDWLWDQWLQREQVMFGPSDDGGYPSRQCDVSSIYDFAGTPEDQAAYAYSDIQKAADAEGIALFRNAMPEIIAVLKQVEDFRRYCAAREAVWASWGQCEDAGHIGHTEETCPAWGSVASTTLSDGDPAPIFAALAALESKVAG